MALTRLNNIRAVSLVIHAISALLLLLCLSLDVNYFSILIVEVVLLGSINDSLFLKMCSVASLPWHSALQAFCS